MIAQAKIKKLMDLLMANRGESQKKEQDFSESDKPKKKNNNRYDSLYIPKVDNLGSGEL